MDVKINKPDEMRLVAIFNELQLRLVNKISDERVQELKNEHKMILLKYDSNDCLIKSTKQ